MNAVCGVISILLATKGLLFEAGMFIIFGAFFDFFDGMAARLLKASSPIGKELDSLSDMVTFGVAPAIIMVKIFARMNICSCIKFYDYSILSLLPILLAVFAGLRLAKFNIDTRQTESFLGLPTPASAMFVASLAMMTPENSNFTMVEFFQTPIFLIITTLALCILNVSELPLFSLKVKTLTWSKNYYRYLLVAISIILFVTIKFAAIPIIISLYILMSLIIYWIQPKVENNV